MKGDNVEIESPILLFEAHAILGWACAGEVFGLPFGGTLAGIAASTALFVWLCTEVDLARPEQEKGR